MSDGTQARNPYSQVVLERSPPPPRILLCVGWRVFERFGGLTCDFAEVFEGKIC
jgi:hypothetical protein